MSHLPTDPQEKRQLWSDLKSAAPELVDQIAALRTQFPGAVLTGISFNGETFGEVSKPGYPIDDDFINTRLSSAERQKFFAQVATPYEKAVLARSKLKGKKR